MGQCLASAAAVRRAATDPLNGRSFSKSLLRMDTGAWLRREVLRPRVLASNGSAPAIVSLSFLDWRANVPKSVLDAIKLGFWDFEPEDVAQEEFRATRAMPGTQEKIEVLASRAREGLPLWHYNDRTDYDDSQSGQC